MSAGDGGQRELLRLLVGPWVGRAVAAAAELGIPDTLADGPMDGAELAAGLGVPRNGLVRLLRMLTAVGLVQEEHGRFALTSTGALLAADHPGSLRELALLYDSPFFHTAWEGFTEQVRTGRPAFEAAFGADVYTYLAARPEEARRFVAGMAAGSGHAEDLAAAHDFSGASRVIDVGGGDGAVLDAVLTRNQHVIGVLVDRPPATDRARDRLLPHIAEGRCAVEEGDFLDRVPEGDVYILSRILHNWGDGEARRILANCRAAMSGRSGRVLIAERVLPDEGRPWLSVAYDLHMMVMTGGAERTASEYESLLRGTGLRTVGTAALPLEVELLEVAPAEWTP